MTIAEPLCSRDLHAFSDGSGGQGTADRRLRICGWGVVFMQSHFVPCLAFCGKLLGAVQTVPRAEIAAAHFAAAFGQARVAYVHRLCIYTDCSLVFREIVKGQQHCIQSPSLLSAWAPLWRTLEGEGDGPSFQVVPVKVKAHVDKSPASLSQPPHLTFGNALADAVAAFDAAY